jgi:hypothetical protein
MSHEIDIWSYNVNQSDLQRGVKHLSELIHNNKKSMKWADAAKDRKIFWDQETVYWDKNLVPLTMNSSTSHEAHSKITIMLSHNLFSIPDGEFGQQSAVTLDRNLKKIKKKTEKSK